MSRNIFLLKVKGGGQRKRAGWRQMETDRWRQRSGELAPSPPCLKERVSLDKIIWLFSLTPGGDMPFTWRGPVSMRLHVCVC